MRSSCRVKQASPRLRCVIRQFYIHAIKSQCKISVHAAFWLQGFLANGALVAAAGANMKWLELISVEGG